MMAHDQVAPGRLKSWVAPLLIGATLVAPFIVLLLTPALRRLRVEGSLRGLKLGHWAGLLFGAFLGYVYAEVDIDQLPCFLGVPNCD